MSSKCSGLVGSGVVLGVFKSGTWCSEVVVPHAPKCRFVGAFSFVPGQPRFFGLCKVAA